MDRGDPMAALDRRTFLKLSSLGATALGLDERPAGLPVLSGKKTERVVLVALAGGIRTRETFGTPANVPNLLRIAEQGVVYPRTRATNLGHFGSTLAIFTGISEARGIRENTRGTDPTLFEYLRKDLGWKSSEVWISTSGGTQEANASYSLHPEYGYRYGANTVDGDGIFNAEFKGILDEYGRPREMDPQEQALVQRMRASIGNGTGRSPEDTGQVAVVERFLMDELKRGT